MRFGERLKQARQDQHLTQKAVAEQLHVSRQTISSWETENSYPDIDSLLRLSDLYGLSLDTLLREDSGMTDYLRRQDVRQQITPVRRFLMVLVIAGALLNVVNQLMPKLALMNPVVSLLLFLGVLALNATINFDRKLGLDQQPLFRERHPWFNQYAAWLFVPLTGVGAIGLVSQSNSWSNLLNIVGMVGFGGLMFWLMVRFERDQRLFK